MEHQTRTIALAYDGSDAIDKLDVTPELEELLETAAHLSRHAPLQEQFDLSFTTILYAFLSGSDACSRFFQKHAAQVGLHRQALLERKKFDDRSFAAAVETTRTTDPRSRPLLCTISAKTLIQNAQQLLNEVSVRRRVLDVRHLMGAYIYRPMGHGDEIEGLGLGRYEWSKAFCAFVQHDDADEAKRWQKIEGETFKHVAAPKPLPSSGVSARFMTSSANTAARAPAASPSFDTDYVGEMVPLEADRLGVLPEVNRLARLLAASKVNPPIALGLFGRWGSGKSFFMGLLKTRIRELGKADDAGGYVDNPVQISFNAWHYQDTSLWANLALRIFDGIAHALEGDRPTDIEATRRELHQKLNSSQRQKEEAEERRSAALRKRNEVAVQLEDTTRERLNKDRELSVTRFTRVWGAVTTRGALRNDVAQLKKEAAALGVKADLSSSEDLERLEKNLQEIERHGRGLTAAVAGSFRDPASTAISLAVLAALAAIVIAIGWLMPRLGLDGVLKTIAQGATPVVAAAGWASRRVQQMTHALDTTTRLRKAISDQWTLSEPTAAEKELSARIAVLDGDIRKHTEEITSADRHVAEAAAELLRIDSGGLVYDFLRDRRASNQYLSHVGLISTIRQDFERLRELLEDFSTNGNKQKIGRIILYIDDLDRCESDKVVEVLQAVHLLLAFDIFNVVVGVDGRWLERSLDARYQANTKAPFTAQEYLEKIFQIPYALTAMSEPGFVELVGDLVTGTERPRPLPALDIRDQVEAIALQSYEEAFLKRLAPFIETPRLAKRMTNIYRLLRARAAGDDLETFAGKATAGTYRAALVLLAINMGYPQVGRKILYELARNPSEPSFDALLERMADPKQGSLADDERTAIARIRTLAAPLDNGSALGLAPYVQWAPNVGVYSFDWHPLGHGQLSGQTSPHP